MQVTIEVGPITFEAQGVSFTFNPESVKADALADFAARAFVAGIVKTAVDCAAGAKTYAEANKVTKDEATTALVTKRLTTWKGGIWVSRGVSDGLDAVTKAAIGLTADQVKAGDPKKYKAASPDERSEMRSEYFGKLAKTQQDTLLAHAAKVIEARKVQAATLAAIKADIKL